MASTPQGPTNEDLSDRVTTPAIGSRSDRTRRFLARLDAHLPSITDPASRRAFLDRQIDGWEHRYARFIATDGASEPVADPADPPLAADFLLTIMGLATRRNSLGQQRRNNNMSDRNDQKPLGSAVLSLLVAADQRCPAIIGQAHVLYHARFDAKRELTARTFAQLKRDAADLFQAIADVETAMEERQPRPG
jgi:hypothetical protein